MPSSPSLNAADRAFPAHARADRYFAAGSVESARRRLTQCALRGDGPALLLGAPGVGKTMLLEVLANDLGGTLRVVRLGGAQLCTRRALLQAVLHGLGAPYRDREEGELRLSLADLLLDPAETLGGVALLVDEAQALPTRLLEELRQLSNVALDGTPRVRLVLSGTHALDEAFTAPELDALNQRLAARCYLEPLGREEIAHYVRAHVAAAGADPDTVLADDVYDALARASEGLPRLINQVADRALMFAAERGATRIDAAAIGEAWSDLHQLAAPWQSPDSSRLAAASTGDENAIEFGLLDDEDHDALQAEAEAVTSALDPTGEANGTRVGAWHGVWNAGDQLADLATEQEGGAAEAAVEEDEDLVTYAFPGVGEPANTEPTELDEAPAEAVEAEPAVATTSDATDPFAEDFDEEELVIDPYAELERVIPAAPEVVCQEPSDLTTAFEALPPNEAESASASPAEELPLERLAPREGDVEVAAASWNADAVASDDAILVVEPDESAEAVLEPGARRQDYAELFANLRQG